MLLLIKYTLLYGIVLMLVALGGMFSEHSGIINIALEGIMVIGGVAGGPPPPPLPPGQAGLPPPAPPGGTLSSFFPFPFPPCEMFREPAGGAEKNPPQTRPAGSSISW